MSHKGLDRLNDLEPAFKARAESLLDKLAEVGLFMLVVSTRRTISQQNQLYKQGRSLKGPIVTNAPGGSSPHNFGCAMDLCALDAEGQPNWNDIESLKKMGDIAEDMGLIWGGHFKSLKDYPHVESASWRLLQAEWKAGRLQVA